MEEINQQHLRNQNDIQYLKEIANKMRKKRWLHRRSSQYYSSKNSKFVIPSLILSTLATVFSFSLNSDYQPYVVGGITSVNTLIIGIANHYKMAQKS